MKAARYWPVCSALLIVTTGLTLSGNAQVTPDSTLSTTVSQSGNNFTVTNGTTRGNNLFHSFRQFSVPTGGSAFFNNATTIQNIFARVTGGTVSSIDGLIRANGTANLFLLNSAGILFGPNARLNLGGSFVASTAENVIFADGMKFNTTDTTAPPLLTLSVPIGLQLGTNAGSIEVQGPMAPNAFFRPPTLSVAPKQTLALVGGQLDINSANLTAPDGQIELWAVQNGQVAINSQAPWQLTSSAAIANWGTIMLQQASLVDASGINGGSINVRGRGLTLKEGSSITSKTFAGQGKGITVQTTEFVNLLGVSLPGQISPGIGTSVGVLFGPPGSGQAGDVTVETGRLQLINGGSLQSSSSGNNSRTGDVTVRASEVEVIGFNPFFEIPTSITTTLFSGTNNESGKITIDADRIRVQDGGLISTSLVNLGFGSPPTGRSGDISIRATESLEISGFTPGKVLSGVSTGIQPFSEGQAGNIEIEAARLQVFNGGSIRSSLAGTGQAGNISIQATKVAISEPEIDGISHLPGGITVAVGDNAVGLGGNITLTANSLRVFNGGQITSSSTGQGSAGSVNLQVQNVDVEGMSASLVNGQYLSSAISASATNAFAAGSINVAADTVNVRDTAQITVSNTGIGDAGNLTINARKLFLDNGARLRAEVNGGGQGNMQLQVSDVLLLRHGSNITTNAQGASTGGNININARFIVGVPLENSDIVANAVLGSGGNIQITTQGIFGLKFRPQITPESDITASSQFGISGNVQINTISVDPSSGLVALPANLADSSQQIATGCAGSQGSSFVATGRGGVPQNPTQQVRDDRTWDDMRDLSAYRNADQTNADKTMTQKPAAVPALIQASTWQRHADGTVELMADQSPTFHSTFATCSGVTGREMNRLHPESTQLSNNRLNRQ